MLRAIGRQNLRRVNCSFAVGVPVVMLSSRAKGHGRVFASVDIEMRVNTSRVNNWRQSVKKPQRVYLTSRMLALRLNTP